MQQFERIQDRMVGRWRSVLTLIGVNPDLLTGDHGPCPICGGKDRFRFDDLGGDGTWICNQCGAGNGIDLVGKVRKTDFVGALKLVESLYGKTEFAKPPAERKSTSRFAMSAWRSANDLDGADAASLHLANRGLALPAWPQQLRCAPKFRYYHDDKRVTQHPAMLALFSAADRQSATVHVTYLTILGQKAELPKVRKFMPGKHPNGAAVRLFPPEKRMGISTGIETSIAASILFDVPVWAALNDRHLAKWEPPPDVKTVLVFGDNDANFSGQYAAYGLAHKLALEGFGVEVHIPDHKGWDWNDVLQSKSAFTVDDCPFYFESAATH